jgi:peptide/nickel transport system substrate-binding protein
MKLIAAGLIVVIAVAAIGVVYFVTRPVPKDTLIMGTTDSVESSLDPAQAYDYFGWEIIGALGATLVEYRIGAQTGDVSEIVPALAESWTMAGDSMSWTFNLRPGVHFDDGTEFNATHVKYTFDRGMGIADPDGAWVGIGYADVIKNVTVVSKYVVTFYLNKPYGPFLAILTSTTTAIVDPKYGGSPPWIKEDLTPEVQYKSGDARGSHPLGLGAYKLQTWVRTGSKDSEIDLVANPNYWNASGGFPRVGKIIIKMYSDATALALAISAGDVDIAFRQLTVDQITSFKARTDVHVWEGTGAFVQYLVFQEKRAPFNVTDVRVAVAAALNRTLIVNTVYHGLAVELYSMIPMGMTFHRDAFKNIPGVVNYTLTKQLLAAHGYNNVTKLVVNLNYEVTGHYPQSADLAQVIKTSLQASGVITVNLIGWDWTTYRAQRGLQTMDAFIYGWYPDYVDADDYIQPFYDASGASWLHDVYNNTYMNTLVSWARFNTTFAGRDLNYNKIQNLSVVDCPLVPIYQYGAYAVTKTFVQGVYLDVTQNWRHWYLYVSP